MTFRPEIRTRLFGAALTLGVLALGACDGENLFKPGSQLPGPGGGTGNDTQLPSVRIDEPAGGLLKAKLIGDSVFVQATISDDVGIQKVRMFGVAERGDPSLGTEEIVPRYEEKEITLPSTARDTTLTRFLLATPDTVKEQVKIIVEATDAVSNVSADTVSLFVGGPDVEFLDFNGGETLLADREVGVRVRGIDPGKINRIEVEISGAINQTLVQEFDNPGDTVLFEQTFRTPAGVTGEITMLARATNSINLVGEDGPIELSLITGSVVDNEPPSLIMNIVSPERIETQDSIGITISAVDDTRGSGIQQVGYTFISTATTGDDLVLSSSDAFPTPRTGTVVREFKIAASDLNIDPLALPDTLSFEIFGFAIDASGNCAATVQEGADEQLTCGQLPTGERTAAGQTGVSQIRSVVAGLTVQLSNGGEIMDAVVDEKRENLLLSNLTRSQLEIFRIGEREFMPPVPVGSEPWGLALRDDDNLYVGNSGGTNISTVFLGDNEGNGALELPTGRILTPDVVLFDVEVSEDDQGLTRYDVDLIPDNDPPGFSDRPQFIAVDAFGRIVYSTKTTLLGDFGTARYAFRVPGGEAPEVVLLTSHGELLDAANSFAVERVDGMGVSPIGLGGEDAVTFFDHTAGFPSLVITSDPLPIEQAFVDIRNKGSDIRMFSGKWSVPNIGFQDTTYVASSTDGRWVAFGEGASQPVGRVLMYSAAVADVVRAISSDDLLTNASEVVRGLAMNHDGSLGVALGQQAYFFSNDLRLQGVATIPPGGSGAALHPLHADYPSLDNQDGVYNPDTHMAFLGTGDNTIEIIDAFHFFRRGRIFIRDNVVAPLKAVLPFPGDNAGLTCTTSAVFNGDGAQIGEAVRVFADLNGQIAVPEAVTENACIVLKLFGITDTGGVVVVDVRKSDIIRDLP